MTEQPQETEVEIVSEFPNPPTYFDLYKDGVSSGPSPPTPMEPTYHMFGTPYSTKVRRGGNVVPRGFSLCYGSRI